MSPWFVMALGPALQPWALIGAGAAGHGSGGQADHWETYLALFFYCVLASASYVALDVYAAVRPDQSQLLLARFRTWMETHTDQVIIFGA